MKAWPFFVIVVFMYLVGVMVGWSLGRYTVEPEVIERTPQWAYTLGVQDAHELGKILCSQALELQRRMDENMGQPKFRIPEDLGGRADRSRTSEPRPWGPEVSFLEEGH